MQIDIAITKRDVKVNNRSKSLV